MLLLGAKSILQLPAVNTDVTTMGMNLLLVSLALRSEPLQQKLDAAPAGEIVAILTQ